MSDNEPAILPFPEQNNGCDWCEKQGELIFRDKSLLDQGRIDAKAQARSVIGHLNLSIALHGQDALQQDRTKTSMLWFGDWRSTALLPLQGELPDTLDLAQALFDLDVSFGSRQGSIANRVGC